MEHCWIDTNRGKLFTEKSVPAVMLSTTNPTLTSMEMNLGCQMKSNYFKNGQASEFGGPVYVQSVVRDVSHILISILHPKTHKLQITAYDKLMKHCGLHIYQQPCIRHFNHLMDTELQMYTSTFTIRNIILTYTQHTDDHIKAINTLTCST
jgi:hypothetical protein